MRYPVILSILACSVIIIGCDAIIGSDRDASAPIQTGKSEYSATIRDGTVELEIPHTFTNQRAETVYIVNCNNAFGIKLQKRAGNTWVDAVGMIIPDCLSPAIEIPEGESYDNILQIHAGLPSSDIEPRFEVDEIEGIYRIVWIDVLESFDPDSYPFGEQIPLEQRLSNTFEIR